MLTAILMVTLVVPNLADAERAYAEWLGFRVTERGTISSQLAASWGAPLAAGSPYLLLKSASDSEVYLRVIERPPTPGYAAMRTHGWNSNEILVEDPFALENRIRAANRGCETSHSIAQQVHPCIARGQHARSCFRCDEDRLWREAALRLDAGPEFAQSAMFGN